MEKQPQVSVQGTTLEVLAPYLPYGIEVQTHWKDGPRIGSLSSLNYDQPCVGVKLHGEDELQTLLVFDLCLPVLRPFSQLCEPLEDGTVPALIVAKMLLNDWASEYSYQVVGSKSPTGKNFSVHAFRLKPQIGEVLAFRLAFLPDWNWLLRVKWEETISHLENILQAIDYLRHHHFAVGLEPHQYIEKVASPTKEQKPGAGEAQSL